MAGERDALAALAALERRYDGPIPEPLRRLVGTSPAKLSLAAAQAEAAFFAGLIARQLAALRALRAAGPVPPGAARDLALYRLQRRRWRGEAARLRRLTAVTRSAGDTP